jgi:hypothetical protein
MVLESGGTHPQHTGRSQPNHGVQATAYSLRFASASSRA